MDDTLNEYSYSEVSKKVSMLGVGGDSQSLDSGKIYLTPLSFYSLWIPVDSSETWLAFIVCGRKRPACSVTWRFLCSSIFAPFPWSPQLGQNQSKWMQEISRNAYINLPSIKSQLLFCQKWVQHSQQSLRPQMHCRNLLSMLRNKSNV